MPERSWGNSVGSGSGSTLTLLFDYIARDGSRAWLVNPRVRFSSKPGWSDSTNSIFAGGTAIADGQIHSGALNGGTREWGVGVDNVWLRHGGTTWATFDVEVKRISFFNGDQATTLYRWDIEFPAIPYDRPLPPLNLTNVFVNDNRADLGWQPNYTGSDGPRPWSNVTVHRTLTGTWANNSGVDIATVGWDATSYADTSLQPNQRAAYAVKANNPSGSSDWAFAPDAVYTTPAAPSNVVATKTASGSIEVAFKNNAPWATKFEVRDSPDGANWTVLTTSATGSPYPHSSPSTSVTHRYQVRSVTPDGKKSAWSTTSNIVQLLVAPGVPVWGPLDPAYDATATIRATFVHNSIDTSPQTAYEIRWRSSSNNGTTWSGWTTTGKVASSTSARTFAASTFPQNALIELQVRTWGAYATEPSYSPWSASASLRTSARPLVGIVSPGMNAVLPGMTATVAVNYVDPEGSAQSALEIALFQGAVEVGRWNLSGPVTAFELPVRLEDGKAYRIEALVRDGAGLWSNISTSSFTVVYEAPPSPAFEVSWDVARGAGVLAINNPRPEVGSGKPEPVFNRVYRDGVLIAENVGLNVTFVDPLPPLSGSDYTVEAVSALPSEGATDGHLDAHPDVTRRFWFNAGPGWSKVASFWGNVSRGQTRGRKRTTELYSGRVLPISTIGEGLTSDLSVSGVVIRTEDLFEGFLDIAAEPTDACYRDRFGKWFVSIAPISVDASNDLLSSVKVSMTEVLADEGLFG